MINETESILSLLVKVMKNKQRPRAATDHGDWEDVRTKCQGVPWTESWSRRVINRKTGGIQTKPGVSLTPTHTCQLLSVDEGAAVITADHDADEVSADEGSIDALCIIFDTFL